MSLLLLFGAASGLGAGSPPVVAETGRVPTYPTLASVPTLNRGKLG